MFTYEKNVLKLYQYRVLVHLDKEEIDVLYLKTMLRIKGKELHVNYFAKEEIHIEGQIKAIEMENHHDKK